MHKNTHASVRLNPNACPPARFSHQRLEVPPVPDLVLVITKDKREEDVSIGAR